MPIEFITTRNLENKSGQAVGKIRILKLKEEGDALVDYVCPECGFGEKRREPWSEPFVSGAGANKKFCLRCGKCGCQIKFLKLKKEAAKSAKQTKDK